MRICAICLQFVQINFHCDVKKTVEYWFLIVSLILNPSLEDALLIHLQRVCFERFCLFCTVGLAIVTVKLGFVTVIYSFQGDFP